jgi:type IV pilus assembly protein PilX
MRHLPYALRRDRGSVLVVGMFTLALLSLIGVFATTTATIEMKISGNDKTYKEAFFATELGLTVAETSLEGILSRIALNEDTTVGHYARNSQPYWDALNWDDTDTILVAAGSIPTGLNAMASRPRYAIEERSFRRDSLTTGIGVPTGVYYFNVTSRGIGGTNTAEMVLQTIYAKRFN